MFRSGAAPEAQRGSPAARRGSPGGPRRGGYPPVASGAAPGAFDRARGVFAQGQRRCAACRAALAAGDDVLSLEGGACYHAACLRCSACRRELSRSAAGCHMDKSGAMFCDACSAARAMRCAGCSAEITGRYMEVDGKTYHRECFACATCRRQISGKYFKTKDGALRCSECHEVANPPEICAGCGAAIRDGRSMKSGGQTYHVACFSCNKCRKPIEGPFWRTDDGCGRLCKDCQPRCAACKEPLDGRSYVRLGDGAPMHMDCFKCCDCGGKIGGRYFENSDSNPFRSSTERYRCDKCHVQTVQRREEMTSAKSVAREERKKEEDAQTYRLFWRPSLVPTARQALIDLGVDQGVLARPVGGSSSDLVCICVPPRSSTSPLAPAGTVCIAGVNQKHHGAAVSLPYLACALRVLRDCRREPQFSLDPKDPLDLSGPLLVKRFNPPWLAGTVVGEVLFQADYALKQLCFGDKRLPGIPSAFDSDDSGCADEPRAARQWFTVRSAGVTVSSDGVLVPFVSMGVEARRLTTGPDGYTDAPYTDPDDPWARQAAAVTARFGEVVAQLPVAKELLEVARATVLAVYLLGRGYRCDDGALQRYRPPRVPEGNAYSLEIPTLVKDRSISSVTTVEQGGGSELFVSRMSRSMRGGVDLSVPHGKRLPVRNVAAKLLGERPRTVRLPLFAGALIASPGADLMLPTPTSARAA